MANHAVYGMKRFHTDSAAELMWPKMKKAVHQHGCGVTHNVPGESDSNTMAEVAINPIISMAREMRLHIGILKYRLPAGAGSVRHIRAQQTPIAIPEG